MHVKLPDTIYNSDSFVIELYFMIVPFGYPENIYESWFQQKKLKY